MLNESGARSCILVPLAWVNGSTVAFEHAKSPCRRQALHVAAKVRPQRSRSRELGPSAGALPGDYRERACDEDPTDPVNRARQANRPQRPPAATRTARVAAQAIIHRWPIPELTGI